MPVIQLRLIVGGSAYFPDVGSAMIAGYKDGWSHVDAIVPAGLNWAPEGWLFGARMDSLSPRKCEQLVVVSPDDLPDARTAAQYCVRNGTPRGVQLRPPGYTTFHRCGILTFPVTDQQQAAFWTAQRAKLGRPYDWRAILAFLSGGRNWHEDDSWICSEAVEDSLEKAKILSDFWLAPYKISPGMVAARVEVLAGCWFTEIKQGTDPRTELAVAIEDWQYHCLPRDRDFVPVS